PGAQLAERLALGRHLLAHTNQRDERTARILTDGWKLHDLRHRAQGYTSRSIGVRLAGPDRAHMARDHTMWWSSNAWRQSPPHSQPSSSSEATTGPGRTIIPGRIVRRSANAWPA